MHFIIGGVNVPRPNSKSHINVLLQIISEFGHSYAFEGSGDLLLNLDHSDASINAWKSQNAVLKPIILLRLETQSVFPEQYKTEVENQYTKIYTIGVIDETCKGESLGYPYLPAINHLEQEETLYFTQEFKNNVERSIYEKDLWEKRSKKIVFIGSNKFIPNDYLYALRRNVLEREMKNGTIEVYGQFWTKSILRRAFYFSAIARYSLRVGNSINLFRNLHWVFKNYPTAKGTIYDKLNLLKQSQYNLIIENSPGFVTEKLFDAILCGAVPIYLGANFKSGSLLEKCIIRVTESELLTSNLELIIKQSDYSVNLILESMVSFMSSKEYAENWSARGVYLRLLRDLTPEV